MAYPWVANGGAGYPVFHDGKLVKGKQMGLEVHTVHHAPEVIHGVPVAPTFRLWKNGSYWRSINDIHLRARYAYARDKCNRSSLNLREKYKCFRINWVQYKPHSNNDIDSLRRRVQRECGGLFPNNLVKRRQCFEDHI